MSELRRLRNRMGRTSVMRTDDVVAPGIRRYRAAWITALAGLLAIIAVVWITVSLTRAAEDSDRKAEQAKRAAALSADELQQVRDLIAERRDVRDAERDEERAALCQALVTLGASARPESLAVLQQVAVDLSCPPLTGPASTPTPTPSATGAGAAAAPSSAGVAPAPRATTRPSGAPGGGAAAPPAATAPAPAPTSPAPPGTAPTTPAPPTQPEPLLCVLGICVGG